MSAFGPAPVTPGAFLCPRCSHALRAEQGWCLECGLAARTRIHPPPNWRLPIAATLVALALLAGGIAFALVALLDEREPTPAAATVTVPAPEATTPSGTTTPATATPTTATPSPTTTPAPVTTVPGGAGAPNGATTPAPSSATPQQTFTIPGTGIELPANAD
ncbi:MAG: hypothetical protein WBC33_01700, partial [Conexibacter sp.]